MLFANQILEAYITIFTLFDEPTGNCLQVIAVTWDMVEKQNMSVLTSVFI